MMDDIIYCYREELTDDQTRQRKKELLASLDTAALLLLKAAGVSVGMVGGRLVISAPECWCDEPFTYGAPDSYPASEMMRVLKDSVLCPPHGAKYSLGQLEDMLPRGKRKSKNRVDQILAKINLPVGPQRFYVFKTGVGTQARMALDTEPDRALELVRPSPKQELKGVLIECFDKARALEILEEKADDLPWCEGLESMLDSDLRLIANWHGCSLTLRERSALKQQELVAAQEKRVARRKQADRMRADADRLIREPL